MYIRESSYGYWSNPYSFVCVATGAVVGIGNIARLPYLMGQHGGTLFLLVYLLALILVSMPLMVTEWLLGRWSRADAVDAFVKLQEDAKAHRAWAYLGWISLAVSVLVLSYFSVIAGWSSAFIFRAASGALTGASDATLQEVFLGLAQDPERSLSWHTIFMVICCIIVAHGVRDGIEKMARVWVPIALLMAGIVCAYALIKGNTAAAVQYLITPDVSKLGWRGVVEALHMAFFTLGLGMGVMLTLGTYLPAKTSIVRTALAVLLLDTMFSLIAGLALFSLIFSAGLDPAPGLTLMFQLLPQSLPATLDGVLISVLFYGLIFVITMSAAVGLLEPVSRYIMERYRSPRVFAATSAALAIWYIGLGSLLSFSFLSEMTLLNRNFFEWIQLITGAWLAPISSLLICIFAARILPKQLQKALWGETHPLLYTIWYTLMRYPVRIALITILLYSSGLLDWLASLWSAPSA